MPMITTKVLNTSEAEWIASEIIAPECATIPASSLSAVRMKLPIMLTKDTFIACFS